MRKEFCDDCICGNCMNNVKDYTNGTCRECEQCNEEDLLDEAQRCRDFKSTKSCRDKNKFNVLCMSCEGINKKCSK